MSINGLSKLFVEEISIVREGANLRKPFPIAKAQGKCNHSCKKGANAMAESTVDVTEELKKQADKNASDFEELKKAQAAEIDRLRKENEAVLKSNADLQKAIKAVNDERDLERWVAKAANELSHYPGESTEDLGKMLKSLNDTNPEIAKKQFESMKKASDAIKASSLLKEVGRSGVTDKPGSALDEINKLVTAVVSKDGTKDKNKIFIDVCKAHPELYVKYLDENPQQCK